LELPLNEHDYFETALREAVEEIYPFWVRQTNQPQLRDLQGFTVERDVQQAPALDMTCIPELEQTEDAMWQEAEAVPSMWGRQSNQPGFTWLHDLASMREVQDFTTDRDVAHFQETPVDSRKRTESNQDSTRSNSMMELAEGLGVDDDASPAIHACENVLAMRRYSGREEREMLCA
jgi:hypothetical protein